MTALLTELTAPTEVEMLGIEPWASYIIMTQSKLWTKCGQLALTNEFGQKYCMNHVRITNRLKNNWTWISCSG